jgi:hypothetical protein
LIDGARLDLVVQVLHGIVTVKEVLHETGQIGADEVPCRRRGWKKENQQDDEEPTSDAMISSHGIDLFFLGLRVMQNAIASLMTSQPS